MNNKINTLAYFKRQAKKLKKELDITHTQALELTAKKNGYSNWKHCLSKLSEQPVREVEMPKKELQLTFTDWLMKHKKRDSPLGDLASDAFGDKTWPSYNTLDKYRNYLYFRHADSGAIEALERAWKSYKAYLRRKNLSILEDPQTMKEVIIKDKQRYLNKNYPFENKPKLTDKVHCIHCNSIVTVGDYKVFKIEWEEFICCPNAPECDGTIIDWIDLP